MIPPAQLPTPRGEPAGGLVLRPYQRAAVAAVFSAFKRGVRRQLVVMATGLGKTVVVGGVAARSGWTPGRRFFGLMHREELIEQALEKLGRQNPGRSIDYEKAGHLAAENADIVLASVQTVGRGDGKRLERFRPEEFSKVWIDEVHHSPAKSYVTVLKHFGLYENPGTDKVLIGTTATPERLDRLGYDDLFDDVVYRYGLREGIQDGWLADLACFRVMTHVDLSRVKVRRGDFVESELARAVDVEPRNQTCLEVYREHAARRRNLVFCVTKAHAHHVASLFEEVSVPVGVIVEDTKPAERRRLIQEFRVGTVEVLVNVGVLTEGFDVPEVEAVHLLRPTRSTALLVQMIGRGTRKTESKSRCLVFDYADDLEGRDLATIGSIFGTSPSFDFEGGGVVEQLRELERVAQELGWDFLEGARNLRDLQTRLVRVDCLKLYASSAEETEAVSNLRWHRTAEDGFSISWRSRTEEELASERETQWLVRERNVLEAKRLWGLEERLEMQRNQLGKWELTLHRKKAGVHLDVIRLHLSSEFGHAVKWADAWVRRERPHVVVLLDLKAPWNRHPATPAQIAALQRRGYPEKNLRGLTKGEAAMLFSKPVPSFLK